MFMLFSKAYPYIIDVDADTCPTPHPMLVLGVLLPPLLPTPSSLSLIPPVTSLSAFAILWLSNG